MKSNREQIRIDQHDAVPLAPVPRPIPFAPYQQPGVGVQVCPDFPFPGLPWPVTRYVPAKSLLYLDV